MMPLISLEDVGLERNGKKIFDKINLTINPGERLGIAGRSGSGKTTLIRCIAGFYKPTSGNVRYLGLNPRQDIGMVFQDPYTSLNPMLSIQNVLEEPLVLQTHMNKQERLKRCEELMHEVQLDPLLLQQRPRQLSGGQRQRVGLARAVALRPKLLICDEPFSALDAPLQVDMARLLKQLHTRYGLTLILISHDTELLQLLTHRTIQIG